MSFFLPTDNSERAAQTLSKMASTESELRPTANQMGGETVQAVRQKAHGVPKAPGAMTPAAIVLWRREECNASPTQSRQTMRARRAAPDLMTNPSLGHLSQHPWEGQTEHLKQRRTTRAPHAAQTTDRNPKAPMRTMTVTRTQNRPCDAENSPVFSNSRNFCPCFPY